MRLIPAQGIAYCVVIRTSYARVSTQLVSEEDMHIHYSVFQPIYVAVVTVSQKIINVNQLGM